MNKQKSVIMNRKELHECFMLKSSPLENIKIEQHKMPFVTFIIYPLPKIGIKYEYLVECNIPIRWDKLQAVYKQTEQQDLPLAERLWAAIK